MSRLAHTTPREPPRAQSVICCGWYLSLRPRLEAEENAAEGSGRGAIVAARITTLVPARFVRTGSGSMS